MLVYYSQNAYLCTVKLTNNTQTTKKMEKNYSSDTPIRATIKEMNIEDIIHFPVSKLSVLRSTVSTLNIELNRKYKTKLNRKTMTVDVKRIS